MNAPTTGRPRSALIVLAGGIALAGTIAAGAVLAGRGNATPSTNPSTSAPPVASPLPTAKPTRPPVVTPAPQPSPTPSQEPSAAPSEDPGNDAIPITVELDVIGGDNVYVDIVDASGSLENAAAGPVAYSASVEEYTLAVENVDADTLRLTWVDYPVDRALALYIHQNDGVYTLVLIQPDPPADTDTMVFDRVLFLDFVEPVAADDVEAFLQGGLDTPGDA